MGGTKKEQPLVTNKLVDMKEDAVRRAYARWAPVYDLTFGVIADYGRTRTVDAINRRGGRVLEVGVGTGISLPRYKRDLKVTGIDLSPEMLAKAHSRVQDLGLGNVEGLHEMDASNLEFESGTFDVVVAMYVMTVVPNPEKVMRELSRVCRPGGEVIIVNHFSQDHGIRGNVERGMARFAEALGWRPEFPVDTILVCDDLRLVAERPLQPFGLFTMLRFAKTEPGAGTLVKKPGMAVPAGGRVQVQDVLA
ncbi:phosphatidylethanolamine/phosphatidyl-N-methylethanolamine N-methyltransferase [Rhodoligotrophos appendicifer]|uniref:class I SAM-dependent methyltransferase n=1 Tax=Rhodoligotrophos appendicifer TaxID=987056 RepID=UPI0019600C7A|nr:methyltransferase domain-containing protein [Rhodoligotrophos appendicifer]